MAAVAQDGHALQFVPPALRRDAAVVTAAVTQNGLALQHAPASLRGNASVVSAAARRNGNLLCCCCIGRVAVEHPRRELERLRPAPAVG